MEARATNHPMTNVLFVVYYKDARSSYRNPPRPLRLPSTQTEGYPLCCTSQRRQYFIYLAPQTPITSLEPKKAFFVVHGKYASGLINTLRPLLPTYTTYLKPEIALFVAHSKNASSSKTPSTLVTHPTPRGSPSPSYPTHVLAYLRCPPSKSIRG